ncbi:MAG: glycosyltransferase family 2 protein [Candidatus Levybacteria bacterium]|nr:glycosyltransferase family 2 protein [Candidatus Levybacteria bacterium]
MNYKSISVFLPVFNEGENIGKAVLSIKKYLAKRFKDFEILVISDGSTDNTNEIVQKLEKKDRRIKLFTRNKRLGYGAGLRAGFEKSTKDLIFYTDADNQFDINDMDKLFPLLGKYDIVSAYRIKRKDPLMRIFIANVYNLLVRLFFGLKIKDVDASFKLYKKETFDEMKLITNTGLTDAEVLIKAQKQGFKIGQIGVRHYPRLHGQTPFEIGSRNIFFALVKPKVIVDILHEMKILWKDLKK